MKTSKRYSDAEKLRIIKEFELSGTSMERIQKIYGLGHCTLSRWITKFGLLNNQTTPSAKKMNHTDKKTKAADSLSERILETRVKQLEEELKKEKLRSLAYKTMIEIAEEELGIDISKKAGAKQ